MLTAHCPTTPTALGTVQLSSWTLWIECRSAQGSWGPRVREGLDTSVLEAPGCSFIWRLAWPCTWVCLRLPVGPHSAAFACAQCPLNPLLAKSSSPHSTHGNLSGLRHHSHELRLHTSHQRGPHSLHKRDDSPCAVSHSPAQYPSSSISRGCGRYRVRHSW